MKGSIFSVLCLFVMISGLEGSAIPIWEYLSKQEKTSYIYSLFANQVEKFCEGSSIPFCTRQLMKYGLGTLKNIEEEKLDSMDPYQREANNIIWETLMQGHRFQITTPKPAKKIAGAKSKPNSYEDESFSDYDEFGTQSAASARLDNVYVVAPPKDFVYKPSSENKQIDVPESSGSTIINIIKTPDGEGVFNRFQNNYRPVSVTTERVASSTKKPFLNRDNDYLYVPLTGRMVVRVYPDGTPVRESTQTPQDDDLRQYQMQHVKIPTY
ncbi:rhythmically expressed gene 5 protein [Anthonomus grandis grandis]|uniref:rhythmically expressed gene 5 protein n=1 Tax=Anthonomus grandis grandis TaxID=2921223 RepID=UPI0021653F8F|nr:rhythmically expressed gene 5 protein [Anthonomus grandis grandis]